MKLLVAFAVLTISGTQAAAAVFPLLTPKTVPISPAAIDGPAICKGEYGNRCGDCFTMLMCLGPATPVQTACNPDTPYCDSAKNVCVADKPAAGVGCDAAPPTGFLCTAPEGFFPHPTNCSQYFECYNSEAIKYECPTGYAWDTDGMGCKQRKVTADCGTITCKTTDQMAPLSNNATFYGYCNIPDGLEGVLVTRCPSTLEKYDIVEKACVFQCPAEGLFPDQQNPTFYYECYKSGSKTVFLYKECSNGREFSEVEQRCMPPAAGVGGASAVSVV